LLFNIDLVGIEARLRIFALAIRNNAWDDVRTEGGRVLGMVFVDSLLTVIKVIEWFPGRVIGLPVDIVL
jgi:hypothetical protein